MAFKLSLPISVLAPRLKWVAGYAAFSLFALVFFLFLTFPYDAVKLRAIAAAEGAGMDLRIGSLGPGFFALKAKDVRVGPRVIEESDTPPLRVPIEAVWVRPMLFPPGLAIRADAFDGSVAVDLGALGGSIAASVDDLDPASPQFKALTGLNLEGRLNAELDLDLPNKDLSKASGELSLSLDALNLKGGTLAFSPMAGMDLPSAELGTLKAKVVFKQGAGTVETLSGDGKDLKLKGGGTVRLARAVRYSELNIDLKLKPEPDFLKKLGMIGSGFSILPPDKEDPSFRGARVAGYLGAPRIVPAR